MHDLVAAAQLVIGGEGVQPVADAVLHREEKAVLEQHVQHRHAACSGPQDAQDQQQAGRSGVQHHQGRAAVDGRRAQIPLGHQEGQHHAGEAQGRHHPAAGQQIGQDEQVQDLDDLAGLHAEGAEGHPGRGPQPLAARPEQEGQGHQGAGGAHHGDQQPPPMANDPHRQGAGRHGYQPGGIIEALLQAPAGAVAVLHQHAQGAQEVDEAQQQPVHGEQPGQQRIHQHQRQGHGHHHHPGEHRGLLQHQQQKAAEGEHRHRARHRGGAGRAAVFLFGFQGNVHSLRLLSLRRWRTGVPGTGALSGGAAK